MNPICPDCGKSLVIGDWPTCRVMGKVTSQHQSSSHDAQIHSSEQVAYYENHQTGNIVIPGRGDEPMHHKYRDSGYVEKRANSMGEIKRIEQATNTRMAALNYDKNSARWDRDMGAR